MKKWILALSALAFGSAALAAQSLEEEYFARSQARIDQLTQKGPMVRRACLNDVLKQLKLSNQVVKVEESTFDSGFVYSLQNGDICFTSLSMGTLRTTTLCHSKTNAITVSADSKCNDAI